MQKYNNLKMINDFEIGLPSKLPTKKDDLLGFSFNFENLIKTIDYLHKYNLALFSKLQNFNERMIKFEEISAEFPKLKEIVENLQLYSKEHEGLIKENRNKINENENKINENETHIKKNENKINELSEQIELNKNNITKNKELINNNNKNIEILLNDKKEEIKEEKVSDENLKKEEEKKIYFEEIKKFINENVFQGKQDKEINSMKDKINKINERLDDLQINLDSSKNELERNIYNLINSLQNNGDSSFQLNINNKSSDANLFKMAMAQIEKNKKYIQENIDKFSTNQEKLKQDVSWLKNDISENKKNYQELQELVDEYLEDKKYYLTYKDIKETIKNVDVLFSKVKEFSSFSDIEMLKSDINIRFQQISSKLKDLEELKTKNSKRQEKEGWDPEDLNFVPVTKRITDLIHDLLKSEGKNIDLSKNKHFIELMKLNQQNSSELNKNMKNFLDLKTLISSNITNKDIEILKKDLSEVKNEFKSYKSKISEIIQLIGGLESNEDNKKEEIQNEKIKDQIEGEKYVENKIKQSEETIKGKIEFLTDYVEDLGTKMMKTEKKLNSITKDLKDDMKANLRLDTFKVVEQFKLKLNSFTDKFENELKNKIDKMGLNIFENKLNSKLNMDLKDKLNRNDLKKNNFMINKKIDTLENKISKTLVDTIIDLQMDDAPLLLKKNQKNFEICASCNRPLNDNNNIPSKTIEHTQMSTSPNFLLTSRIKNISSLKKLPVILNSPK